MTFADQSIRDFSNGLASKAPVPGGGGAAALVGTVGVCLASMVANLTIGKQKYADVQKDIKTVLENARDIQNELLRLMDADAEAFAPLAAAYSIPKESPERRAVMERALKEAAEVPIRIMNVICRAIVLHKELVDKGSRMALSDVGVGAACCEAALISASLNVFINTKSMSNRDYAEALNTQADNMLRNYCPLAQEICEQVFSAMRKDNE